MAQYFGTDGIRGVAGRTPMSVEFVGRLGKAAGAYFQQLYTSTRPLTVVIGRDTRLSGSMLEHALTAGLQTLGINTMNLGVVTTPLIALLSQHDGIDFGVVISASHNPFEDNGVKFFTHDGRKLDATAEAAIEANLMQDIAPVASTAFGINLPPLDYATLYWQHYQQLLANDVDYSKIHIVVDTANGAAHQLAKFILAKLGIQQVTYLGDQPNGSNINADCGSTHIALLSQTVQHQHAQLGFALDGDADRVIMVDEQGHEINGDKLIAIIARDLVKQHRLQEVVVTKMSNYNFEQYITQELGLKVYRTKVGDKYVAAKMQELGTSLGGEDSGHIILGKQATSGDGLLTACKIMEIFLHSQTTSFATFSNLFSLAPSRLTNISYTDASINPLVMPEFLTLQTQAEQALSGTGRVFLRKSGTQQLIRVLVEDQNSEKVNYWSQTLAQKIADLTQGRII